MHACGCRTPSSGPRVVAPRRSRATPSRVVCAAAPDDQEPPAFSFAPNERSAAGYTAGDSAGQNNIFAGVCPPSLYCPILRSLSCCPVEPKVYVAGGDADGTQAVASISAKYTATGAAMALVLCLLVARFSAAPAVGDAARLSVYEARFAAELRLADGQ